MHVKGTAIAEDMQNAQTRVLLPMCKVSLGSLHSAGHYENMPISNIQKISLPKTENFQIKTMIFFMFLFKT